MSLVSIVDVIEFLTSSSVPSNLGIMLDKMRDGTSGTFSNSGINNEEFKILSRASVLRCVDGLRKLDKVEFESCPSIRAFAKKTNSGEGALVLAVMSAYHKWYLRSQERGLVEIYRLMQRLDPSLPDPDHNEDSLSQSFRVGKTKKARDKSSKLLKDSLLVVDTWINQWNERIKREERNKGNASKKWEK